MNHALQWYRKTNAGVRAFVALSLIVTFTTGIALSVRLLIVEPEAVAQACLTSGVGLRCTLRAIAVFGFLNNVFGWVAVLAGLFATVSRWRWLALAAVFAGTLGSVLYTFELSGVGLLLGGLVWVQRSPLSEDDRGGEQHA
jgi:hypothetical protein